VNGGGVRWWVKRFVTLREMWKKYTVTLAHYQIKKGATYWTLETGPYILNLK
jgi:hypothetical protein